MVSLVDVFVVRIVVRIVVARIVVIISSSDPTGRKGTMWQT